MCEFDAVVAESTGGSSTVYGGATIVAEDSVPSKSSVSGAGARGRERKLGNARCAVHCSARGRHRDGPVHIDVHGGR